ncbi:protein TUNICAMYCIN INDUCED 1 [Lotus japonicus]|uniref:protein TUNICAMYCIN INDUCED 1 n=1 Tax=Lotus japonicus TaxID=34305 RepID=UPI00258A14BC|nr:protein TUNICAMYCIN INDUCED 1 [Lotus japonicus]
MLNKKKEVHLSGQLKLHPKIVCANLTNTRQKSQTSYRSIPLPSPAVPTTDAAKMITGRFQVPLFIFLIQFTAFASSSPSPSTHSNLTHILQDVLKAISTKEKWDLKEVRVLKLDVGKVRFGNSQDYKFRIGFGKNNLTLKFSDQVSSWNKFRNPKPDLGSLIRRVSSLPQLDSLKLNGPFELRVDDLHHLSLSLPMNVSYSGLKHILVGEGITVEVRGAREISLFYSSDLDLQMNGSTKCSKGESDFWPFMQSMCLPLIPIRIFGSASLIAYRARNPYAHIETTLISDDTVELLSEKCYHGHMYRKRGCPIDSLSLRLSLFQKVLRSLIGHKILQDQFSGLLKANIKASADVKFPLELERDIGNNITLSLMPDWRTRPSVERVWFEIIARVEENRLKPILIKKVKPFIESDSISWANLMSNMSYTKLRPALLPPESLTLDVKW